MGQTVSNVPLTDFVVKSITDSGSNIIQEISTANLLSTRIDEGATYMYIGAALPGSAESDAVWRICRYTLANVSGMMWADGSTDFNQVWNDRSSLVYS